jgi:hypothetical protein
MVAIEIELSRFGVETDSVLKFIRMKPSSGKAVNFDPDSHAIA